MINNDNLSKRLSMLGFPLLEVEESQDANSTLVDVVKSKDLRLWEGFPVILANSMEKGLFNYDSAKRYLKNSFDESYLDTLIIMSLALYEVLNLKFSWANKFYRSLQNNQKKKFDNFVKKLKKNRDFKVVGHVMSSQRLKSTFNGYFSQGQSRLNDLLSIKEQFDLEYSLSQVFSSKQKELFLKKLKGEKLTKTEKEYFSRVVKKKVVALANPELHRLSQKLLR
ncbi:unnamed protein product [marine sediment metagenome]|uniref:Uncharacterized protein n=1 Tax=marine sediment metagenome TaxID=412755 RepID=X1AL04_9ZZZZ